MYLIYICRTKHVYDISYVHILFSKKKRHCLLKNESNPRPTVNQLWIDIFEPTLNKP